MCSDTIVDATDLEYCDQLLVAMRDFKQWGLSSRNGRNGVLGAVGPGSRNISSGTLGAVWGWQQKWHHKWQQWWCCQLSGLGFKLDSEIQLR